MEKIAMLKNSLPDDENLEPNPLEKKLRQDVRLLAAALTTLFNSATQDEGPFTGLNQDLYVFIPNNQGSLGGLTIEFAKQYTTHGRTIEYTPAQTSIYFFVDDIKATVHDVVGVDAVGRHNSRNILLPVGYDQDDIDNYMNASISQIASATGVIPDGIKDAMAAEILRKKKIADICADNRKLPPALTSAPT